jgi:hypothetical protein
VLKPASIGGYELRTRSTSQIGAESWRPALLKAAAVVVLAVVGFMIVPDRLLVYLSTRVSPHIRDAIMTLWTAAFFGAMSFAFTFLQKRRRG